MSRNLCNKILFHLQYPLGKPLLQLQNIALIFFHLQVIIKRQYNIIRVAFLLSARMQPTETSFLIGYAEEMLSTILRCIVKLEVQMITSKKDVIFRYL